MFISMQIYILVITKQKNRLVTAMTFSLGVAVGLYLLNPVGSELELVVNFISDFSQPAVTLVCR